jgi:hypothetical protein
MKLIKKSFLVFLILASPGFKVYSQSEGFNAGSIVVENVKDVNALLNAYAAPALKCFGNNLGQGWYSTAAPLKPFRFELKILAPVSLVPTKDQSFNLRALNLNSFKPATGEGDIFPTILGKEADSAKMEIFSGSVGGNQISKTSWLKALPLPIPAMPYISPQLSIGLPKGTELMLRYTPDVSFEIGDKGHKFKLSSFGVGIKHDVAQWIPVLKILPFSLSAYAAYSRFNAEIGEAALYTDLDVEDSYDLMAPVVADPNPPDFTKQKIVFSSSNWTVGGIISKKLAILTVFGGLSLSGYSTEFRLEGGFPVLSASSTSFDPIMTHVTDPVALSAKQTQVSATGGLRIKLLIMNISLSGNYVPGGYSSAAVSLGFGYFN